MTMIADRPAEVEDRVQVGHWERDSLVGARNRSAIGTLVERVNRFVILIHVSTGRPSAEAMREDVVAALGALTSDLRRTLTWDQGKELSYHQQITAATGTDVFFCDAHSPWQRGSNENTNGLLRDYFPKGTDLDHISPDQLQRVADKINDRHRRENADFGRASTTTTAQWISHTAAGRSGTASTAHRSRAATATGIRPPSSDAQRRQPRPEPRPGRTQATCPDTTAGPAQYRSAAQRPPVLVCV